MKINAYTVGLLVAFSMSPSPIWAQPEPDITVDCDNITIEECSKKLPFAVVLDPEIAAHKVVLNKITATPLDGLKRMLDDSGIANYVISFDGKKNNVTVLCLINSFSPDASRVLPNKGNLTTNEGKAFPQPTEGGPPQRAASYPVEMSTEELKSLAGKANEPKTIDPDEEISLLGGEKVTLRQLQVRQERADVSIPVGELNLGPVAGDQRLTYDDLKAMKTRADAAAKEVRGLTLLNGESISHEELKSLHELGKTTGGAVKGISLQKSTSLPSGPGLVVIER